MIPDLLKIADGQMEAFKAIQEQQSLTGEVDVAPQRYVAAYDLAAHANDLAIDAIDLTKRKRFASATPLTRLIFECAMHCQWLVMNPTAHSSLLTDNELHRERLTKTLRVSQSFKHLLEAEHIDVTEYEKVAPKNIRDVCEAVNDGDSSLYIIYRSLSSGSHSGIPLIERWIAEVLDPPGLAFRVEPSTDPTQFNQLAGTIAISLLWTNSAFNCMTRAQPMQQLIDENSRELETKPLLGVGKLVL
ncbi:hypothetical protein F1D05_22610 [Kribbella qitaiheensis]|uniref:Uncharacterized protein n=1 Tax=Kribbella qitaiheensis TaxID=1544730 RepID=A0A7G6X1S4_9ACTN|nr:DUF5677 domain-containing protein [Kribbella qitaiheensis]QNE20189.1 hypothetical protein F1D05_22610 [Kribbella qitaiheensis]